MRTISQLNEQERKELFKEIKRLGMIFVYGSNSKGIHGKGAALTAKNMFGAVNGKTGYYGQSYGINTVKEIGRGPRQYSIDELSNNILEFLEFASSRPEDIFFLTMIGCGLAGYEESEIFKILIKNNAHIVANIMYESLEWHTRFLGVPRSERMIEILYG